MVCIISLEGVVVLTTTNNSVIHDGHMDTLESVGIPYWETIWCILFMCLWKYRHVGWCNSPLTWGQYDFMCEVMYFGHDQRLHSWGGRYGVRWVHHGAYGSRSWAKIEFIPRNRFWENTLLLIFSWSLVTGQCIGHIFEMVFEYVKDQLIRLRDSD